MKEIYLDKNENPFNIPDAIKEKFIDYVKNADFNRYPEKGLPSLIEGLGRFTGLGPERIIAANGSDELLDMLIKRAAGDIVISSPTFEMYSFYATNYGHSAIDVPLNDDFSLNAPEIIKRRDAKLVIICSPNNPTGNLIGRDSIKAVLESGVTTVLDNAYYEFSGEDYTDLIRKYDNLIILRTFSKAFSLAGMRVGYGMAKPDLMVGLKKLQAPFYMNILSAKLAEIMMENYSLIEEKINYIVRERKRVYGELGEIAYNSDTNFLMLKKDLYDYLAGKGIHIRKLPLVKDRSRITIGTAEENNILISAVREYIKNK
ncbi:MAG: histidinol-phosphate transaminase [Ferroplasma sp.]|uniref:histidinol-phosphate transaminase n=1 Tax=Ferroplasma sp. TaxID=2591003 RepID=UPI002815AA3E|nr:histidinol-phosphate transaminase [Ferroplasma sp.]WMT51074.1 MAG: histidinol-phosphate transaminase [Ferroplasma sp.]